VGRWVATRRSPAESPEVRAEASQERTCQRARWEQKRTGTTGQREVGALVRRILTIESVDATRSWWIADLDSPAVGRRVATRGKSPEVRAEASHNDGADWTCHREGLGATGKVRGGALPQQDSRAVYEGESQVARRKGRRPWSSCHVVGQMYRTCKVSNRACTVNRSSDTGFRLRV